MPGMIGLEVIRKVRNLRKGPYVYIIMLTMKAEKNDLVEAIEAGADDFVSKPFNAQELRVRLRAGQRIIELQDTLRKHSSHI